MIVNYNNIAHNALYIKSIIKETKLCAVVKANAYGHGIVETARVLKGIVNYFAVFTLEEAQAIDDINVKILILQPLSEQDLLVAISRGYEVSVDSFTSLTRTLKVAKAIGARAKIHIKLDTGMHRFGFFSEQVEDLLEYLCSNYAYVKVCGIYSHFSSSESDSAVTSAQYDCFMNIAQYLKVKVGDCDTLLHISSTYSTLHYPYKCDMVRVGLGLYGYEGKDNSNLLPAKFVTAEVVAKKIVKQGEKIGYDGAYCAEKDIGIAIINMGYSNGLIRSVADSDFKVKIGEFYAKFVGKICMNCCTVDISENFDKIEIGSEAEFLTDKYNFAKSNIGAIYELLCSFR